MTNVLTRPTPTAAPSLYHNRGFMLLTASQFISRAGDALIAIASVILVLDLTGNNPMAAAGALAFEFIPFLLFGLVGGVLVDRWDRQRTMVVTDAARGALLLLVPVVYAAGALEVWHIYAASFALSSLGRLFTPARQAVLPDLVEPSQLTRANAIVEGTGQAAWVLGPALGGMLVAVIGAAGVYYLDAVSFFISAAAMLLIRVPATARAAKSASLWGEAMGGVRFVRGTPVLAAAIPISVAATVAFAPVPAMLPVMVRGDLASGAQTLGLLMACFFLGSVAGSAVAARAGDRLHRGRMLMIGVLGVGLSACALAAAPTAVAAAVALALLGGLAALFNVAEYSLLQQQTPAELRGRVFAVAGLSAQLLRVPALIAAGLIAGTAGVRVALAVLAIIALGAGAIAAANRALRDTR